MVYKVLWHNMLLIRQGTARQTLSPYHIVHTCLSLSSVHSIESYRIRQWWKTKLHLLPRGSVGRMFWIITSQLAYPSWVLEMFPERPWTRNSSLLKSMFRPSWCSHLWGFSFMQINKLPCLEKWNYMDLHALVLLHWMLYIIVNNLFCKCII